MRTDASTGLKSSGGDPGWSNQARGAVFEYVGVKSLTVIGPVTRKIYFFAAHGARAGVDQRDAEGLRRVPLLVQSRRG